MYNLHIHNIHKENISLEKIQIVSNLNTDENQIYFCSNGQLYSYDVQKKADKEQIQQLEMKEIPENITDIIYNADSNKLLISNTKGLYEYSFDNKEMNLKIEKENVKKIKLSDDCNFIMLITETQLLMYTPEFMLLNTYDITNVIDVVFSSNIQFVVVLTTTEMIVLSTVFNVRDRVEVPHPQCMSIRPSCEFVTVATDNVLNLIEENCNVYKKFAQPTHYRTKLLQWNATSQLLLQIVETEKEDILLVDAYCYGKLIPKYSKSFTSRIQTAFWNEVNPNAFHIITDKNEFFTLDFLLEICCTNDSKHNILIHPHTYKELSLTDLNRGIMPPPLCHKNIPIEMNQYIYATIINDKPYVIIIDVNNVIHFMNYNGTDLIEIKQMKCPVEYTTNICLISEELLMIVDSVNHSVNKFNLTTEKLEVVEYKELPAPIHSINKINDKLYSQLLNGLIISAPIEQPEAFTIEKELCFDHFIPQYTIKMFNNEVHVYSLFQHKFYDNKKLIEENVNSYFLSERYIFFTTLKHKLYAMNMKQKTMAIRSVERGSTIISYVPHDTKLIFQMPRGNLEIIHPRGIVLDIIVELLEQKNYRETFNVIRRHKVNYNFLRDFAFNQIVEDIPQIIDQINKSDVINAFLLSLENGELDEPYSFYLAENKEDHTEETKTIALAIRQHIANRGYPTEFVTTFIATYLLLQPIEFDVVLRDLFNFNEDGKKNGITYLSTFFPINALFKSALKTQSKAICRFVIQYSSLDPKEYEDQINALQFD